MSDARYEPKPTRIALTAGLLLLLCACPKVTTTDGACMADGDCTKPSICCLGKCTNVQTSVGNCGACQAACSAANGAPKCTLGQCSIGCSPGFGDCNKEVKDGCEVDLSSTQAHCGKCKNVCAVENAAAVCERSQCIQLSCNAGFGDCDGFVETGCEINTAASLTHCGGCGKKCEVSEGTAACVDSVCTVATCNADKGDCDKVASTGCETDLRVTDAHCSACNAACPTGYHCKASKCEAPELVVYGGVLNIFATTQLVTNQVSTFNTETHAWKGITTAGTDVPGNRAGHVAVWDTATNRMLVWGGFGTNNSATDSDVYALDFAAATPTWSKLTVSGSKPPTRAAMGSAFDPAARVLYVFGGGDPATGQYFSDLWQLDVAKLEWSQRTEPFGPSARNAVSMAWDSSRQRVVVGNGFDALNTNPVGFYGFDPADGGTGWSKLLVNAPTGRGGAAFLGQAVPLTFYGGFDEFYDFDRGTYVLNPDGGDPDAGLDGFARLPVADDPDQRAYFATASTTQRRFVIGGFGFDLNFNTQSYTDVFELIGAKADAGATWVRIADGGINFAHPGTVYATAVSRE